MNQSGKRPHKGIILVLSVAFLCPAAALSQLPLQGEQSSAPNPLTDPTSKPGKALNNGQAPSIGRVAIAKSANWKAKDYQLTWTPTDAQMGPSGDMGYTWGHFEGISKDAAGNPVKTTGRYITVWRKQADGNWKVALDAGANEPAAAGDCCKVPNGGY
jgi:Domain of unknown function (DUF4440)